MAFKVAPRARQTCTAPGIGAMVVSGTVQGAQTFASYLSNADTTWAVATNGTAWQEGNATYASGANSLTFIVDSDFRSSNSNALVNFSTGTVDVSCDLISLRAKVLERLLWSAAGITPPTNDGTAIGTAALAFSDLFLASGAVIDFNNGDVVATHSSNALAFTGASGGYSFDALLNLSGAAAGQVSFPAAQNASANANTLDDYEEFTFTPTLTFGGAAVGMTYNERVGTGVKIGQQVHWKILFYLSAKGSSTGNAVIGGLPYTSAGDTVGISQSAPVAIFNDGMTVVGNVQAYLQSGATTIVPCSQNNGVSGAQLTNTAFSNTSVLILSGSYRANA